MGQLVDSKRGSNAKGFTVLEVAVAMIVLSIGLLGLASIIPLMKADVQRSDTRTEATFLAEETAEWLHGLQYSDSLLVAGTHADDALGAPGFTRNWTVEDNTPFSGLKRITVVVTPQSAREMESALLVFLYAKAGR